MKNSQLLQEDRLADQKDETLTKKKNIIFGRDPEIAEKNAKYNRKIIHRGRLTAGIAAAATIGGIGALVNHKINKSVKQINRKLVTNSTLAALGAGIGIKALLKYLRKKKEQ